MDQQRQQQNVSQASQEWTEAVKNSFQIRSSSLVGSRSMDLQTPPFGIGEIG